MTTVARFMSQPVVSLDGHCSLDEALELMAQHRVRHLAVMDRGAPVGMLSERDIYRWRAFKPEVEIAVLAVFEAMSPEPYTVAATEPLASVAAEMARRQVGAALVMDGARLAGIFTTSDALRALGGLAGR